MQILIGRSQESYQLDEKRKVIKRTILLWTRYQVPQRSRAGNLGLRPPGSVHQSGFGALKEGSAISDRSVS